MTAYDKWLEAPFQNACEEQDEVNEVVEQLLADECNAQDPSVFMEAINEGACLDSPQVFEKLKKILEQGHSYEDIGHLVWDAVNAYCEETAENRAETIIHFRKQSS